MKNCSICEFREMIVGRCPGIPDIEKCIMKEELIHYPRVKALCCKWFTLDSKRRKAIEKYNEIQAI